jgi:EAL domain-containing protein (putative c-di-GMP-specific phosphodiesterase class I)
MARRRIDHPGYVLLVGAALTIALVAIELTNASGFGAAAENVHVLTAAGAATVAMILLACRPGPHLLRYRPLSVAIALTGLGLGALDLAPALGPTVTAVAANLLFVAGTVLAMVFIVPALYRRLEPRAAISAGLDGGIMWLAGTTIVVTLLLKQGGAVGAAEMVVPILASALCASAGTAAVAALSMRVAPAVRGVWCGIAGVSITGLCWVVWVGRTLNGETRGGFVSILYSAGILVLGYAWMTWSEEVGGGKVYRRIANSLTDWLPAAAILTCVLVAAVPHARVGGLDPAQIGTAAVIVLTIVRQRLLILSERSASRRLAREVEERAQTMLSLGRLEQAESLEETARRICLEALRLDAIDAASVYAFGLSQEVVPLALEGAVRRDEHIGEPINGRRALHIQACAGAGTWVDGPDEWSLTSDPMLLGEAFAPMRWDDRVIGVVAMGTTGREDAIRLAERLPTLTEFGVVSSALMGPMLAEHWRIADVRAQLESVIANHAFTPVFQPIVRLSDRAIVGYEALTRFTDGTRPDTRFLEAHAAGMSVRLEMACLGDQLEAASWLAQGTWVSLNVSPALASAIVPLVSALERADRPVVLEITEHVVISDYRQLVGALDLVRGKARLAVDDAGAGYAGLRHILELRPQFVKLDISLVRNIDSDPARQAMVTGMAHFAQNTECELIAEGIETDAELAELIRLGIQLGQGFLLGKPAPIG